MGAFESVAAAQAKGPTETVTVGMSLDEIELIVGSPSCFDQQTRRLGRLAKLDKLIALANSWFFGTSVGQYVFLAIVAMIMLIVGTIAWTFTEGIEGYDTTLNDAIWLSYTMFIDIGTQTGVSADESDAIKITVVVLSILGFTFNLTFLSVVVDNVRTLLDRLYTRYSQLFVSDHVVILGWTSKTLFLVDELISMFIDAGGKGDIVIMGNAVSRYEMLRAIELTFRRRNPPKPSGVRIRVWEGDAAEEDDLTRLSINAARFVVCLAEHEDPRIADTQILESLLSILSLDDDDQLSGTVIAELRTADARRVLDELNHNSDVKVLGVQTAQTVGKILGLFALRPALGLGLIELISFEGHNFLLQPVPEELHGLRFQDVVGRLRGCVLCGLLTRQERAPARKPAGGGNAFVSVARFGMGLLGGSAAAATPPKAAAAADAELESVILFAPPADRLLKPTDLFVLIALDASAVRVGAVEPPRVASGPSMITTFRSIGSSMGVTKSTPGARRPSLAAATAAAASNALKTRSSDVKLQQVVVVLGWRAAREMADLVNTLSELMLPGSEIHFLSAVDEAEREAALRSEISLLSALSDVAGLVGGGISDLAGGIGLSLTLPGGGSVSVEHHAGSPLASGALELLPLSKATVAIVIGDPSTNVVQSEDTNAYAKGAVRLRDARVFHITTLLRRAAPQLRTVPIYEDIMTYRLLKRNVALVDNAGDFDFDYWSGSPAEAEAPRKPTAPGGGITAVLHRNSLETGLIAMQADNPRLVFVLAKLIGLAGPEPQALFSLPMRDAWEAFGLHTAADEGGHPPLFISFTECARQIYGHVGHVLIGYHDAEAGNVVLNPGKKRTPRQWLPDDELLLLRAHGTTA